LGCRVSGVTKIICLLLRVDKQSSHLSVGKGKLDKTAQFSPSTPLSCCRTDEAMLSLAAISELEETGFEIEEVLQLVWLKVNMEKKNNIEVLKMLQK
jgi:hypothetical protein